MVRFIFQSVLVLSLSPITIIKNKNLTFNKPSFSNYITALFFSVFHRSASQENPLLKLLKNVRRRPHNRIKEYNLSDNGAFYFLGIALFFEDYTGFSLIFFSI